MPVFKKKIKKIFDVINLQENLDPILSFLSEFCEVPYAFVSLIGTGQQIVKAQIGFDFLTIPESVLLFNEDIIQNNKIIVGPARDKEKESKKIDPLHFSFDFFAGFPICSDENVVIGTLCIMDAKPKELSAIQLMTLKHSVVQIQSLVDLHIHSWKLQKTIKEQKNHFQLFIGNSKEILYELDLEGIFTYVSKNLIAFLGREVDEFTGKNIALFIHPDDLEMCISHLNNLVVTGKSEKELIYRILHKDGHYVWHSSNLRFLEKEGNPVFIGNCRDVTQHIEAQQKLLQQKEFYEKILDRLPTDVAVFDSNHRYLYINPAAIKNDELRKFIIGKNDFEYAKHTGRADTFAKNRHARFMQALEARGIVEWEDTIQRLNGETKCHARKFAPVFLENGAFEMMVGFGVDITESKKHQEEILKSRQLTKNIIQNVAVGILIHGTQYEIIDNNKAACEMFGLSRNQLLGKTPFDEHWKAIYLDGSEFLPEDFPVAQAIKQLKPLNDVVMGIYRPKFNDYIWILANAIPVFGEFGELLYVICSFSDITSRIKAEDSLRISNERFNYSSKATSDALWDWDIKADKIYIGEGFSNLFGHKLDNDYIDPEVISAFIHPDDIEIVLKNRNKALESDSGKWHSEYSYLKLDGTYACVKDKAVIIRNEEGKAIRMIGAMQDITLEKKLKDELQQSEEQFKGVFENSAVGMALVKIEGFYIEVNERLCQMLGYTSQEMKLLKFQEITHHDDLALDLDYKEQLDSGKLASFSSEKRFIHKNKAIIWVHMFVSAAKNSKNEIKHYIVQLIDITERKEIERQNKLLIEENNHNKTIQLDEAKNLYRLLADNTVDLICLHNLDTSFQYVSPSIEMLLGYSPEELTGKFPSEFVHPEDMETIRNSIEGFLGEQHDLAVEIRFRNKEGHYCWFESKASLVKENGVPVSFQSSTRDISQRKDAEKIIEYTLIQERELNELRTNLVSTISHEFRTPMTTIRTSAELITMYLEGHDVENSVQIEKRLNTITEEIDRIVELMNAVLTISKEESGKTNFNPVMFDLKQVCLDVIDSSYGDYDEKRKVETSFEGDSFYIFADKNLMRYCIFNVLNNAIKYSKGLEDILFRVFATHDAMVIEIIDSGIGIPEQDQSKLFNTFFRGSNTDGVQGTGLGLYIVKSFAEKNAGTVHLESQVGIGTKVTLKFPLKTQ